MIKNKLPEGWQYKELGKTVDVILGQSPASSTYNFDGDGLPFFQGKTEFTELYPEVRKWCNSPKKTAQKDDVLVSVRAPVGPTNLAPSECAIGRGLAALRVSEGQDKKYYLYLVRRFQNELASLGTGTTFEAISGAVLKVFKVPVAPPAQQTQIVAKIEELFSHIDAGIESLKTAKHKLKQYRQSVLKAAVTGELTKDWREQNANAEQGCSNVAGGTTPGATKIEPASQLLKRILKERQQRWEQQQLEQFQAKGKPPKNVKWKEKYKKPIQLKKTFNVPIGWVPTTISQVAECIDNFRKPINKKDRADRVGTIPYYGANGPVGLIDDFLFDEPLVLVVEDETFVGRTIPFSYKIEGKAWVNNHAHVLRPTDVVDVDFLNLSLMYYPFIPLTSGSTGRRKLTQKALNEAPYSLPSREEQKEIVQRVEEKLTAADRLMAELDTKLTQAQQQKQTILTSAFCGELV